MFAQVLGAKENPTGFTLTGSGVSGTKDDKATGSLDAKIHFNSDATKDVVTLGFNANVVGDVVYFKIQSLPEQLVSMVKSAQGFDVSFLNDKWIKIDPVEVKELMQQFGASESDLASLPSGFNTMSDEDRKAIVKAWQDHPFIELKEAQGTEEVDGTKTDKYSLGMNYGQLKPFAEAVKPQLEKYNTNKEVDYDEMLKEFDEETLKEALKDVNVTATVWVGQRDNQIYKVEAVMKPAKAEDAKELKSITFTMNWTDHGKDVTVETPADAMTLKELVGEVTTQFAGAAMESGAQQ